MRHRRSLMLQRAFTLLEVVFAVAILVLSILGTLAALSSSGGLRQSTRETLGINEMFAHRAEHLKGIPVGSLSGTLTNPVTTMSGFPLNGGSTEGAFTYRTGPYKGMTVSTRILSEVEASLRWVSDRDGDGTPGEIPDDSLDLDGDGVKGEGAGASVLADYDIAPIEVRIDWVSVTGQANQQRSRFTYTVLY